MCDKVRWGVLLLLTGLVFGFVGAADAADDAQISPGLGLLAEKGSPLQPGEAIAFLGDSITQAGADQGGYCRLIADAIAKGRPEADVKVIYAGISGNKVPDLQARLERDVLSKKPTVVFVYIGINDVWHSQHGQGTPKATYEAGLRDLMKKIGDTGAIIVLATPSVIGEKPDASNPLDKMLDDYAAVSRQVAVDTGVTLCDLREAFVAHLKENNRENKERGILTSDGVHLNTAGNRLVADQAARAIAAALKKKRSGEQSGDGEFRPIFDGKTLEGWDGNPKFWRVEDGAITGETTASNPTEGNTFIIWRGGKPADFELKIEYRLRNHNSGIQFRSWEEPDNWGKWVVGGYQADIADVVQFDGMLYGERYRGFLCPRGEKTVVGPDHQAKTVGRIGDPQELLKAIKRDGWNEYHIIAKGNRLTHSINGQPMVDCTDDDVAMRRMDGIIALQLHAGPPMKVQFRNIRLKELAKDTPKAKTSVKKVVFIPGGPSHGYSDHEHRAGCLLLAQCLKENLPGVDAVVCDKGWPQEPKALDDAATIVIYADGADGQPMIPHLDQLEPLMKQGVGLACIHFAVEVPKGRPGNCLKDWIGGYFELDWSVNPFWTAQFKEFPQHPIARGLKPFSIQDEWYYHMRFRENLEGVTPILVAVPPDSTRGPDGGRSGNPTVRARKGMAEVVGWACERPNGGRGFGFTGGHSHWNWANDNFRKAVLNGIAWTAHVEIPPEGVASKTPSFEQLEANQDKPQPKDFDRESVRRKITQWNKQG